MSLDQIRYFVAVADEGTTREAARRLHVSQPPLSRQIKSLEGELGVELFQRSARGMSLNPPGQVFLVHARQVLAALDEAVTETRLAATQGSPLSAAWGSAPTPASPGQRDASSATAAHANTRHPATGQRRPLIGRAES